MEKIQNKNTLTYGGIMEVLAN